MTNREARLCFRRLKHGVKRSLTNNYKKLHGEHMLRAGTLFEYGRKQRYHVRPKGELVKKRKYYRRTRYEPRIR